MEGVDLAGLRRWICLVDCTEDPKNSDRWVDSQEYSVAALGDTQLKVGTPLPGANRLGMDGVRKRRDRPRVYMAAGQQVRKRAARVCPPADN